MIAGGAGGCRPRSIQQRSERSTTPLAATASASGATAIMKNPSAKPEAFTALTGRDGEVLVLIGHTRHRRTASGLDSRGCSRGELCDSLREDFGMSGDLVQAWVDRGGLDASFEAPTGPAPPVPRKAPSRRVSDLRLAVEMAPAIRAEHISFATHARELAGAVPSPSVSWRMSCPVGFW
jgi:hypothetical protein